jgi:hypothetical protein
MAIDSNSGLISWKPTNGTASTTISVVATDSSNQQTDTKSFKITVNNVAPVLSLANAIDVVLGSSWSLGGTWTDPGTDTWTAEVDYGDGSGKKALPVDQTGKSLALQHLYNATGIYNLTVSLRDGDGGVSTQSRTVNILPKPARVTSFNARTSRTKITQLELTFDTAMDSSSVQNMANYQLISAGRDGKLGTRDDTKLTISKVTYNSATRVAMITSRQAMTTTGIYRLTALATSTTAGLKSGNGKLIDGDNNGSAGGNYIKNFGKTFGMASIRAASLVFRRKS